MKVIREGVDLEAFLRSLRARKERVLLLDYDGTLAPFRVKRSMAFPYEGVRDRISTILRLERCRTVIISGRSIKDLPPLLGIHPLPEIWGCHGWERLYPDGTYAGPTLGNETEKAFNLIRSWAASKDIGSRCESKPASIAVHWRGIDESKAESERISLETDVVPNLKDAGIAVRRFDGGLEFVATGNDKGTAVKTILRESGDDAAIVYMGDDLTDEKAFEALSKKGLSLLVRPEFRKTAADAWLIPPGELLDFLDYWIEGCALT
ncbi:MAG: trehalose-phosphatase [Candidatus Krumholzibacteria bacterium]|nr:trehalose-phosphatase [Candidatus Krumholzibacteria bacterium]